MKHSGISTPDQSQTQTMTFKIRKLFIGRVGRRHFLSFLAVCALVNIANRIFLNDLLGTLASVIVITIPIVTVTIGMTIRRFHDFHRSGWWVILPLLVQISLNFSMGGLQTDLGERVFIVDSDILVGILTVSVFGWIGVMAYLIFKRGDKTANQFGGVNPPNIKFFDVILNQK